MPYDIDDSIVYGSSISHHPAGTWSGTQFSISIPRNVPHLFWFVIYYAEYYSLHSDSDCVTPLDWKPPSNMKRLIGDWRLYTKFGSETGNQWSQFFSFVRDDWYVLRQTFHCICQQQSVVDQHSESPNLTRMPRITAHALQYSWKN